MSNPSSANNYIIVASIAASAILMLVVTWVKRVQGRKTLRIIRANSNASPSDQRPQSNWNYPLQPPPPPIPNAPSREGTNQWSQPAPPYTPPSGAWPAPQGPPPSVEPPQISPPPPVHGRTSGSWEPPHGPPPNLAAEPTRPSVIAFPMPSVPPPSHVHESAATLQTTTTDVPSTGLGDAPPPPANIEPGAPRTSPPPPASQSQVANDGPRPVGNLMPEPPPYQA